MEVTVAGIDTDVNPLFWKDLLPITVTPSGIAIDCRKLQSENASLPMLSTLGGMVIDVSPLQPRKAPPPITVTSVGITVLLHPAISVLDAVSIIALHPSRESYTVFPSLTENHTGCAPQH